MKLLLSFVEIAMGAWVLTLMVLNITDYKFDLSTDVMVSAETLVTVDDRFNTSGHYFLFSGSINQNPIFSFYRQDKDGNIFWETLPASSVIIRESDKTPQIQHWKARFKNKTIALLFPNLTDYYIRILVPKGSILEDYKLGAQ